jgi:hypothetical protein
LLAIPVTLQNHDALKGEGINLSSEREPSVELSPVYIAPFACPMAGPWKRQSDHIASQGFEPSEDSPPQSAWMVSPKGACSLDP